MDDSFSYGGLEPAVQGHILPHSLEAEQSVLGALMIEPASNQGVIDLITESDFHWPEHKAIIKAILSLSSRGLEIDQITVDECLNALGRPDGCTMAYLSDICENAYGLSGRQVWSYVNQVLVDKKKRRGFLSGADEIKRIATTVPEIDQATEQIQGVMSSMEGDTTGNTTSLQQVMDVALAQIDDRLNRPEGQLVGIPTGLADLDHKTMGYQPGLIIVAGRPAMGKTVFGLEALLAGAQSGYDVLGINLEMANEQLAERALSSIGDVFYDRIRDPKRADSEDFRKILDAGSVLKELRVDFMDNMAVTLARIKSVIRSWHKRVPKPGLVMIDYLQLFQLSNQGNKTDQLGEVTRSLKILSRELSIPIMLLSQLNRTLEQRQNKRPVPSDLRSSGDIEQDADLILFLYRDVVYNPDSKWNGVAEIIIGKGRNIELGTVYAAEQFNKMRFRNLAVDWTPPQEDKKAFRDGDL